MFSKLLFKLCISFYPHYVVLVLLSSMRPHNLTNFFSRHVSTSAWHLWICFSYSNIISTSAISSAILDLNPLRFLEIACSNSPHSSMNIISCTSLPNTFTAFLQMLLPFPFIIIHLLMLRHSAYSNLDTSYS